MTFGVRKKAGFSIALVLVAGFSYALASSHREAPFITSMPKVDGTDFYIFRSYEPGRDGFVTLIANYSPLQDPYGGPNYFSLDPDARYDIHINNDGDAVEDISFCFRFFRRAKFLTVDVGGPEELPIALPAAGPVAVDNLENINVDRHFYATVHRGPIDDPTSIRYITQAGGGGARFVMPQDNIGEKTIPDYAAYANQYLYDIDIPGCDTDGRLFVGQRKESFQVNLGKIFDLLNITDPLGAPDAEESVTAGKNITSIILEVPTSCLTEGNSDIICGWTTAKLPETRELREDTDATFYQPDENRGRFMQVSRLGNPLVNEVAIGLSDKNLFNASHPKDDAQFAIYVTHPTLPEIIEAVLGVTAPNVFPRVDLVQVFLTGVPGLNQDGSTAEYLRLNTAIAPTPRDEQNSLGVVGGDLAGYPNGRRPGDDAVDIALRAMMGVLLTPVEAPDGQLPYTDGVRQGADQFDNEFPYLTTPIPGSRTP